MEATEYPLAQGGFPNALDPGEPILLLREGMDGDVCLCLQTLKQLHTVWCCCFMESCLDGTGTPNSCCLVPGSCCGNP